MCWKSNKKPKQRTAKEDVIVYKLLIKTDDPNVMMSPINPFEYAFHHKYENPPMKIIKNVEDGNTEYRIYEGFHSFSTFDGAQTAYIHYTMHQFVITRIVECIIPKDSHYYRNGDYCVSDSIIINKILHDELLDWWNNQ